MKLLKILGITFAILIIVLISVVGVFYYQNIGQYDVDKEKYPHYIGYLDPATTISDPSFKVCDNGSIYKTHHGGAPEGYKPNKGVFRKNILDHYVTTDTTASGYLFYRFIVNCKGETGRFEITGTDLDMNPTIFADKIVDQLHRLTANSDNWSLLSVKEHPINYYMYIGYKIEYGHITEILP